MKILTFRRKREGRTDYRTRIKMLSSRERRLVVRVTLKNIIAQIIEYSPKGDKVIISANPKELKDLGWKYSTANIPAAYLMGYLIGTKAKKKKIESAILDIGLKNAIRKSKIFAFLKGAVDSGLDISHSAEAFPDENRIKGKHIEEYAKSNAGKSQNQFKEYSKNSANPESISKAFDEVKTKIK